MVCEREYGKLIYTDITVDENGHIEQINDSKAYIASKSYFHSIIINHIEFFKIDYLFLSMNEAIKKEIECILNRGADNTQLGRLIYNIYEKAVTLGANKREIYDYINHMFFNCDRDEIFEMYMKKINNIMTMGCMIYDIKSYINRINPSINHIQIYTDFSSVSDIYFSEAFKNIITPEVVWQLALEYDLIIVAHGGIDEHGNWTISEPILDHKNKIEYTNVQSIFNNFMIYGEKKKGLFLICNPVDCELDLAYELPSTSYNKTINYPNGEMISELYLPNCDD